PLTLEQALSYAGEANSPELAAIYSREMALNAESGLIEASDSTQVTLDGQIEWAEPLNSPGEWVDNHKASISIRKSLYDFGRIEGNHTLNRVEQDALRNELISARWQRREQIMTRFFNVLLADRTADRNEEEMAGAFIQFDRIGERQKLGQASDLEVLQKESHYQQVFLKRNRGIAQQRLARSQLAIALNRAGDLPENLTTPELPTLEFVLPEYELILNKVLSENRALYAMNRKIDAAQQEVSVISKGSLPSISGEIVLADTTRPTGTSDRWRVGVKLSMPLYDGGSNRALLSKGRASIHKLQADRDALRADLERMVLSEWLRLQELRQQAKAAMIELDYRELYLDNSRAEYELEFKTDLGNAMVKISEAQLEVERNRFQQAISWEKLDALTNGAMADLSAQAQLIKSANEGVQ
ncbi:MAG: TolC family protein, partial [Gammaproteobacteria bacterium]|nr:TolC family protein [Gammaproteobacteria bacterium]